VTTPYAFPDSLRRMVALAAAALLAGCAAVPDLGPMTAPAPATRLATAQSFADAQGVWPEDRWWTRYGDPQLAALVDEALAGSPDLAAADARLRRAEGLARAAGAALLPTLAANAQGGYQKQSYNNGIPA
jgi:outer membrane protein TolC